MKSYNNRDQHSFTSMFQKHSYVEGKRIITDTTKEMSSLLCLRYVIIGDCYIQEPSQISIALINGNKEILFFLITISCQDIQKTIKYNNNCINISIRKYLLHELIKNCFPL